MEQLNLEGRLAQLQKDRRSLIQSRDNYRVRLQVIADQLDDLLNELNQAPFLKRLSYLFTGKWK